MTRLARIALLLLTTSLVTVSVSLWVTQQMLRATQEQLIETRGQNAVMQEQVRVLSARIGNIESGVTIPTGARKVIIRQRKTGDL